MSCVHVMASPDSNAGVLVCSECFERSGHKKAKILLESICLDPSSHGESTRVRVHLIAGVLSPEVRPTPRAHFRGEFILCTKPKCEGLKCKYPHCLKEKAAWNAEKFGYSLLSDSFSRSEIAQHGLPGVSNVVEPPATTEQHSISSVAEASPTTQLQVVSTMVETPPKTQKLPSPEPWPDFPGFGARTMEELQMQPTEMSSYSVGHPVQLTTPLREPNIQPPQSVPIVNSTSSQPPAVLNAHSSPRVPDYHAPIPPRAHPSRLMRESGAYFSPSVPQASVTDNTGSPQLSYANAVARGKHISRQRLVPFLESPQPKHSPQKLYPYGGVMRSKIPETRAPVIQHPLDVSNYHLKFRELLKLEEAAHAWLLRERCDGKYKLSLFPSGQKPGELRVDARPCHARFGYLQGMGCDEVAYATQSASNAVIEVDNCSIQCDILRENNFHAEERLYIALQKPVAEMLTSAFKKRKEPFCTQQKHKVHFRLKFSYFRSLKEAIRNLRKYVIERILPSCSSFVCVDTPDSTNFEPFRERCSPDQFEALKVIAAAPTSGPPVLISGPFGTGKTRVLAIAAHYFVQQSVREESRLGILVCSQQHNSADAYLEMYSDLTSERQPVSVIRLVAKDTWRKNNSLKHLYKSVEEFKKEMERDSHRNRQRYIIVTTCLTAKHIVAILPPWFFTHIFLDEGAQMREPEAVAALCMASPKTKLVIAGDKFQVGPAMLVLGEEPQTYGLSVSMLERLYNHYCEVGEVAKPYCAHLSTNFRCHRKILDLARQVAYKMPLKCMVPDHSAHPDAQFPLRFMCTSFDSRVKATDSSINEVEVKVALKDASNFFMQWPVNAWGKRDLTQICFLSPCRGQVTVARNAREALPPQVKHVRKVPTYQIQGQEFRALFISTSEPTTPEGETRDSTKSISDPAVFITALTRAQSLVVAVGNPFMLLKREQHMVKKYGDRGHCWSLFLKACIDNNTLIICQPSDKKYVPMLTQLVNQTVSHLLPVPLQDISSERDANIPSINVIPDTPTQSGATATQPTDRVELTESHDFKDHVMKEILGGGGFGVVCSVQYRLDKKEYALKIVRLPDKQNEQTNVMREVEALARLDHPNIVRYYHSWKETAPRNWKHVLPWQNLPSVESVSYPSQTDYSERLSGGTESQAEAAPEASATSSPNISSHSSSISASESSSSFAIEFADHSADKQQLKPKGTHYDPNPPVCLCIKTELCDKTTLRTWMKEHRDDRTRKDVTTYFCEMLDGVGYIHSHGLIHRDLKPSNIFFSLAATESERKIKIGDFGLVTTSQVGIDDGVQSRSKYLGTTFYMSPEQKKNDRYGREIDVYTLGIIYFEMNYPFATDTGMERGKVFDKLCKGIFPEKFENTLSLEASIVAWMLTEDPQERPSAEVVALSPRVKKLKKSMKKSKAIVPKLQL